MDHEGRQLVAVGTPSDAAAGWPERAPSDEVDTHGSAWSKRVRHKVAWAPLLFNVTGKSGNDISLLRFRYSPLSPPMTEALAWCANNFDIRDGTGLYPDEEGEAGRLRINGPPKGGRALPSGELAQDLATLEERH